MGTCEHCKLTLHLHTVDTHDCRTALRLHADTQARQLEELQVQLRVSSSRAAKQERQLLRQLAQVKKQLGDQTDKFNKTLKDVKNRQLCQQSEQVRI